MCLQGLFNIHILIIKRKLFVYFFPNIMKINFENFTGFCMPVQKNPNYYYYYYYCTQNFCIIWSYQIIYNIKYLYICLKFFFEDQNYLSNGIQYVISFWFNFFYIFIINAFGRLKWCRNFVYSSNSSSSSWDFSAQTCQIL